MATVVNPVYLLSIQKVVLFGFVCEGLRPRFQGNSNVSAVESIPLPDVDRSSNLKWEQ